MKKYELRLAFEDCMLKINNLPKPVISIKIEIPEMNTFAIQKMH